MSIYLKRREFLLGAAKLGLSMPTIHMLLKCDNVLAAEDAHPDTLVLMYISNGSRSYFEPTNVNTYTGFTPIKDSSGNDVGRKALLSALKPTSGPLSPLFSNLFDLNQIGLIRGVDWPGTDGSGGSFHNPGAVATGSAYHYHETAKHYFTADQPSIDQVIDSRLDALGMIGMSRIVAPRRVLVAMASPHQQGSWPFWSYRLNKYSALDYADPLNPTSVLLNESAYSEGDPVKFYDDVISGIVSDPNLLAKIKAKKSVASNIINAQFKRILSDGRKVLSKKDREFFEAHLALIQQQKSKIDNLTTNSCTTTGRPAPNVYYSDFHKSFIWNDTEVYNRLKNQIDTWVLARMCGLSQTLVLHVSETDLINIGDGDHHDFISHNAQYAKDSSGAIVNPDGRNELKLKIEQGYMEVFRYLIQKLDTTYLPDSKSILQKTLCVFNNSAGTQPDGCRDTHLAFNFPIVVASRHPSIKAIGKYLDYRDLTQPRSSTIWNDILKKIVPYNDFGFKLGVQINRFHLTLAKAFGMKPEQYPTLIKTNLGIVHNNDFNQYDDSKINLPLDEFL